MSAYGRILDVRDLNRCRDDYVSFHSYFRENRIFLSPVIKDKLDQIDTLMRDVWSDRKFYLEEKNSREGREFMKSAWNKYNKETVPIMDEIEQLFQDRLFPEASG